MRRFETEIVLVGSGPAGASAARELAELGKDVLILERGREHRRVGSIWTPALCLDKAGVFARSEEGVIVERALTLGGSTLLFAGNAFDPPAYFADELDMDLSTEVGEVARELDPAPMPEVFSGPGMRRLTQAAGELGIRLEAQRKFIDPEKCRPGCDACMLGCRYDAKWTARRYVYDALDNGARLRLRTKVQHVLVRGDRAVGVRADDRDGPLEIMAQKVILCAGGIGTPEILRRSGILEAGCSLFVDPMVTVMGTTRDVGSVGEMTFSLASTDFLKNDGFLLGNVGAANAFISHCVRPSLWRHLYKIFRYGKTIGMFAKIADSDGGGTVGPGGRISKPLSTGDRAKLAKGASVCERILVEAGADPGSVSFAWDMGVHPGGTAAIGTVVDEELRTRIENLYVCDASVFPRSPGIPPVLTLLALARRFARRLAESSPLGIRV